MANNYYGTVASLAWILGHYFYNGEHYVWLAEEYYPYRLPNPKSSNPHLIYQDLYQPWKDKDDYDKFVREVRLNQRKGVIAKQGAGVITSSEATDLKQICDQVDITFLYPVVYKVDIDAIDQHRQKRAGSALAGSHEVLVEDLKEKTEFEIFFLDYEVDPDFKKLVVDELNGLGPTKRGVALTILKGRC
jgi:hypothetical protein